MLGIVVCIQENGVLRTVESDSDVQLVYDLAARHISNKAGANKALKSSETTARPKRAFPPAGEPGQQSKDYLIKAGRALSGTEFTYVDLVNKMLELGWKTTSTTMENMTPQVRRLTRKIPQFVFNEANRKFTFAEEQLSL